MSTNGRILQAGWSSTGGLMAALVAAAMLAGSSFARADEDCNWYAQMTAKQMQLNQSKNCGVKGDGWGVDKAHLIAWCQSVPPDEWRKAVTDRQKLLETCGS